MPMEIEGTDEKRPLSVDPPKEKPASNVMQRLRFRRYAQIFKEGLDLGLPHGLDLYSVLYDKGAS